MKPSGRPIEAMSAEDFSRTVRDLDAKRRRHKPSHVVITRDSGTAASVMADKCLDVAFDFWAFEPHRPIVVWIGRTMAWHYYPCKRLAPREF